MNCPQCKTELKPWIFDIGRGVTVRSLHCTKCQFNITDEDKLQNALVKWREKSNKDVRVVAVGEGLGIRFPKELVEEYDIRKGVKVTLKPGKKGIEVML